MATIDEITDGIQRRLHAVLEAAERLRAAIDALGVDNAATIAERAPLPTGVQSEAGNRTAESTAGMSERSSGTATRARVGRSERARARDAAPPALLTPRDRVLSDLRRELAAGLRNI